MKLTVVSSSLGLSCLLLFTADTTTSSASPSLRRNSHKRALDATTTAVPPPPSTPSSSVCIIGAGASGLSTNLRLQAKGYAHDDIVIFEKETTPGGKALDYKAPDGKSFMMGAITGVPGSYRYIDELLQQYQVNNMGWFSFFS